MKNVLVLFLLLLVIFVINGCKKEAPVEEPKTPATANEPAKLAEPAEAVQPVELAEEKAVEETAQEAAKPETEDAKLVPIPLELPKPMFVGTPENLSGVENLEKPLGKPRPAFLAPEGTQNLALDKPVTSSEMDPIMGDLEMVVDGDKNATEGSVVELGPFVQWVQVDLEKEAEIFAVVFWHYHKTPRVYFDVVVQISNDEEFITDVTTIYNNDLDNSSGLGVGTDKHYVETAEGRLVDAKGVKGRYVRLYSQSNNQNDYNHYIEVEVYGK